VSSCYESAGGCRGDRVAYEQWCYNSTMYEHWSGCVSSKCLLIAHNKLASAEEIGVVIRTPLAPTHTFLPCRPAYPEAWRQYLMWQRLSQWLLCHSRYPHVAMFIWVAAIVLYDSRYLMWQRLSQWLLCHSRYPQSLMPQCLSQWLLCHSRYPHVAMFIWVAAIVLYDSRYLMWQCLSQWLLCHSRYSHFAIFISVAAMSQ